MTTQTESESSLDCWAIVEVMGRKSYSGKVSEEKIAGHAFVRVDVPETPGCEPFTKLIGPSSIYCITPVSEEIARSRAQQQGAAPVSPWDLDPELRSRMQRPAGIEHHEDNDDEYDGFC